MFIELNDIKGIIFVLDESLQAEDKQVIEEYFDVLEKSELSRAVVTNFRADELTKLTEIDIDSISSQLPVFEATNEVEEALIRNQVVKALKEINLASNRCILISSNTRFINQAQSLHLVTILI